MNKNKKITAFDDSQEISITPPTLPPPFYKRAWYWFLDFYYTMTGTYVINKVINYGDGYYLNYYLQMKNNIILWNSDVRRATGCKFTRGAIMVYYLRKENKLPNISYVLSRV
jgi:hypothetical protein